MDDAEAAVSREFTWADYVVFVGSLVSFVAVAVYATISTRKSQHMAETELIGDR